MLSEELAQAGRTQHQRLSSRLSRKCFAHAPASCFSLAGVYALLLWQDDSDAAGRPFFPESSVHAVTVAATLHWKLFCRRFSCCGRSFAAAAVVVPVFAAALAGIVAVLVVAFDC